MVPVIWWAGRDDVPVRGYWDQEIVERLIAGAFGTPARWPHTTLRHHVGDGDAAGDGAVVIVAGGAHSGHTAVLTAFLAPLRWVLLVVTSDEASAFPWRDVEHPNMAVWVQTPRRDRHDGADGVLPVGYPPGTIDDGGPVNRPLDWFFAGQITNPRREAAVEAMRHVWNGRLVESPGFAQGLDRAEYQAEMRRAKVVPCPGGIVTPDTFRACEAFAAGAVPILDVNAGEWKVPSYWPVVFPDPPPVPVVDDWTHAAVETAVDTIRDAWPRAQNRVLGWWRGQQRRWATGLVGTLDRLGADLPAPDRLRDLITVVMPTSPIPSHPSTRIIDQTIASIDQAGLGDVEILVTADGVRAEQDHHQGVYDAYLADLVRYTRVTPTVHVTHQHQARMTRQILAEVTTPLVLFVEHDTPLLDDIDWPRLTGLLLENRWDLIRLYHEPRVPDGHEHLHGDRVEDLTPTRQWSQRPHLARVDYYRRILDDHFAPGERWMIEDRMHSVVESDPGGHRLAIWTPGPEGNWQRSTHLDGRAGDPKWVDR